METRKILTILVVALGLMVCLPAVSKAAPMGTAFTYQGHLYDNNDIANDLYDFQFKLYDANSGGSQVGGDVNQPDVDVIDGYFTVELDFGSSVFDGNARWLEIGVRPGEMNDPNVYTILSPRQEVTPTPYAIYAASGPGVPVPLELSGSSSDPIISGTNTGSGDGVQGESWGSSGRGIEGWALWSGPGANYGGYFRAEGSGGYGVYGYASNSGNYENYGGYFMASGNSGIGVYGFVMGDNGHAVQGMAFDSGAVTNYGGYFTARGASGRGVYGEATKTGAVENYGGYFKADGTYGRGVYGHATGSGYGVQGESSGSSGRGVYGLATGSYGMGVYGHAPGTGVASNYGGYFMAAGDHGKGIYGINTSSVNYGYIGGEDYAVYGEHKNGVYGYLGSVFNGVYGYANSGRGVHGYSSSGRGVYGSSSSGIGVYGESNWYAGWFEGTIRVEGDIQYTGNLSCISDIRLKENITLLRGAIEKVSALKGIYFNFKGESSDNREVGVIAQDVEKVLPELVSTDKQGYKSVDYTKLTPVLIEAVKELKAENELLKQRLETQEKTLQQIQTVIMKGAVQ
jgi:hypothetical protein